MHQSSQEERLRGVRPLLSSLFASERLEQRSYQFAVEPWRMRCQGVHLEAILNTSRYDYVYAQGLTGLNTALAATAETTAERTYGCNADGQKKLTLRQHAPATGGGKCPLDKITNQLICPVLLQDKEYALVINTKPWGHQHCMLVTSDPAPQIMTEQDLLAGFQLLKALGPDYEGIFTGVLAGASIDHFHLQIHKGAAMIWQNLGERSIWLRSMFSTNASEAYCLEGWPAQAFVFQGSDQSDLASFVSRMLDVLIEGENDIPYNLGFRCWERLTQLILFPRALNRSNPTAGEKPANLNDDPNSWGRFAFMEMAGSVFVLTPCGLETTSPRRMYDAIAEMSIATQVQDDLIRLFRKDTVR